MYQTWHDILGKAPCKACICNGTRGPEDMLRDTIGPVSILVQRPAIQKVCGAKTGKGHGRTA